MKQALRVASLILAVVICVFTFVTLLYRSDLHQFEWGTELYFFGNSSFSLDDLFFILIPLFCLISAILSLTDVIKSEKWLFLPLGAAAVYSVLRLFRFFLSYNPTDFSRSLFTPISLLLLTAAALFCFFAKPGKTVFPTISLLFLLIQCGLFALTLILKKNFSSFIVIQAIYLSGIKPYYFMLIFLSVFLFYLAFYLFCAVFPLSVTLAETPKRSKAILSEEKKEQAEEIRGDGEEADEEDDPPLTLEDFGIER